MLLVATWSACLTGDAVESVQTPDPTPAEPTSIVTAEDIPSDIVDDSWARLPLPQRNNSIPRGSVPSTSSWPLAAGTSLACVARLRCGSTVL